VTSQADIAVRAAGREELPLFAQLESSEHARDYVGQSGLDEHERMFEDEGYIHLTILSAGEAAGFFLLVLENDGESIDCRRIVVSQTDRGIGQASITAMEAWCRENTDRSRIWLNVYEFNHRGIHVYKKLGYRYFRSEKRDDKVLLYFDQPL
jgi:RimJ/RimL family protein N-acetyltransferase